ncbi:response regulator transcription factor [Aquabacterium sp. OR-4]|nr:response regulator transcription factor [Aquabacterium sp. OR-4]MDT7835288.1 response regulator transcription factor [Aquabacterium sp. OR-4]
MTRVILVDDHALVRMGFRMLLADAQMQVLAELDNGDGLVPAWQKHQPDVVVLDLSMPGMGGLEALRRLLAVEPQARVLVLSAHEDTAHPQRALRAGALGYLSKRGAPEALIAAVRAVAAGQPYVDAATARVLALAQIRGDTSPAQALSEREFSVFIQLARGQNVAQIAEALKISASTVGTHLYKVKQKLGVSNQSELTLVALQWGLLQA